MNKRERVMAAIEGRPVDRVPLSFWLHNFAREHSAQALADETLRLYRTFDWDFVKPQSRYQSFAELWGLEYRVPADRAEVIGGRAQVEIGIRPQALGLVAPEGNVLRGTVLLREPLGLEDEFLIQIDGASLKAVTAQGRRFPEGSAVGVAVDPAQVYVFDLESGRTLCCGLAGSRVDDAA